MRPCFALVWVLWLTAPGAAQNPPRGRPQSEGQRSGQLAHALEQFKASTFRAHMAFLADDKLEGRGTGSRGHELAALYVATEFESYGLEPAGDRGTYFQRVPFREISVVADQCELILKRDERERALKWGDDFLMRGHELNADAAVEAPVAFVGYGVTAPNQHYDDYAAIETRGKIAAYLLGAPAKFPSEQRAHFSSSREKFKNAVAHGAVGVIVLDTPESERSLPWERVIIGFAVPTMRWLGSDSMPNDVFPELHASAMLSLPATQSFFEGTRKSWDQVWSDAQASRPQAFDVPFTARLHSVSKHRDVSSPNVVAALRGSDPQLKAEYVVYTAHTDHLGISRPIDGDSIYNGAVDNASGTAALLEIAKVFSQLPRAPARSILFLAVTGEEKGLLGSDYYAHFPTVPKEAMVANINMDGASVLYDFADIIPLGVEHSSLMPVVQRDAARLGVKVSPDPMPEEVFFVRSDQYSFVRQGIPAVFIMGGLEAVDPGINGRKVSERWIARYYHSPFDDMQQPLDFKGAIKFMKLNFVVGYDVASTSQRPTWNRGDFFGELFSRK